MLNFYTGYSNIANWSIPMTTTICFWVILRGFNLSQNRFFGSADNYELKYLTGSGKFAHDLFENSGGSSTTSPAVNTRYHYAVTGQTNPAINRLLYINAVLETTNTDATAIPTSPATIGIGRRNGSAAADNANADIEDLRVYNRILTAEEIKNIYVCNGRDGIINGLLNRWIVNTKGTGAEIGADVIIDEANNRQNAAKFINDIYYRGGNLTSRRNV